MKLKKHRLILLLGVGSILGLIVLIGLLSKPKAATKSSQASSENKASDNSVVPPIPQNSKNVLFFGYSYSLGGTVEKFEKEGKNYNLVLKKENPQIPEFHVLSSATVFKRENDTQTQVQLEDIKKDDRVVVNAMYDSKRKLWSVVRIYILTTP